MANDRPLAPHDIPGFKPKKDGAVVRQGRWVFLYGAIRLRPSFARNRKSIGVTNVVIPVSADDGPKSHKAIEFKSWQAAERFFAAEFNSDDGGGINLDMRRASGISFDSPTMNKAFSSVAERLLK